MSLVLGLDFGSQSVRVLVVDSQGGAAQGTGVCVYPAGHKGVITDPSDPDLARQSPAAYLEAMSQAIRTVLDSVDGTEIVGIGVGTTGSTPLPLDQDLKPLSETIGFADNPAALAWMWKDHTAHQAANDIVEALTQHDAPYLSLCGGTYSSEWFWAKILHCARTAPDVFEAAHIWVELQDFIPATLCGHTQVDQIKPGICAAGHKGLYSERWGGYPSADFLDDLHPGLGALRDRLPQIAQASDTIAGRLSEDWAARTGLPAGIPVAVGCLDAHASAIGSGVRPGRLIKIVGTSTCDIGVSERAADAIGSDGICGTVNGSVIPGMSGLEAGQAAVGDLFAWAAQLFGQSFETLESDATKLRPGASGLLALDWNNGNRSVLMDSRLSGLILGQSLLTQPSEIYRALIEATGFCGRMILDRFDALGARTDEIVLTGGVALKSPLLQQIYADIFGRPVRLDPSEQSGALGATILASVMIGDHGSVLDAQDAMCAPSGKVIHPIAAHQAIYDQLHGLYVTLTDAFGRGAKSDLAPIMKTLLTLRDEQRAMAN